MRVQFCFLQTATECENIALSLPEPFGVQTAHFSAALLNYVADAKTVFYVAGLQGLRNLRIAIAELVLAQALRCVGNTRPSRSAKEHAELMKKSALRELHPSLGQSRN